MPSTKTGNLASILAAALAAAVLLSPQAAYAQKESQVYYGAMFEQFEYRFGDDSDLLAWDGDALIGTDEWKLRLQSEGEYELDEDQFETLENQLLVQRMFSKFFDLKAGIRHDSPDGPDRTYAVLGVQGLAPQWFEIDADLFISENGDPSARLDVDYELLITNRVILTPTAELNVAFSDDAEIGVGSGFSSAELGLRLGYDLIYRAVAPYVGISYERKLGETADFARDDGEDTEEFLLVAGVRLMF